MDDEQEPHRQRPHRCGARDPYTQACPQPHVCYLYLGHDGDHHAQRCYHHWPDAKVGFTSPNR